MKFDDEASVIVKALKSEFFALRPEIEDKEPARILTNEACSTKPEDSLSEALTNLNHELLSVKLEGIDRELENSLNNEVCSVKPVADEPMERVRVAIRVLKTELDKPKDPLDILISDVCSANPEARPSELVRDRNNDVRSAKFEVTVKEALRFLGKLLVSEPVMTKKLFNDLKIDDLSTKVETEPIEPLRDLNSDERSVNPEPTPSAPGMILRRDVFSAKLESEPINPDIVLNNEVRSTKPEVEPSVLVRDFARFLVSKLIRPNEAGNDLNNELCLRNPEVAVREMPTPLNNEVCSVKPDANVNELPSSLNMEFFSARLEPRINEPVSVLNMLFRRAKPEVIVIELVGFRVQVVGSPAFNVQETGVVVEA